MVTIFLGVIYAAFISLGLPDSALGAIWPTAHTALGVPVGAAGVISVVVSCGTVLSSLFSARLMRRFGTGRVTLVSVTMTAVALLGYSFAPNLWVLCLLAVPLGIGAGAVDAGLNSFVALHYKAHHMNWLHCCWGIGATLGPILIAAFLSKTDGWRSGIRLLSILQWILVLVLFFTLPMWDKYENRAELRAKSLEKGQVSLLKALKISGVPLAILTFFFYCAAEGIVGLWGASYLVGVRNVPADTAARFAACFFVGITIGRALSGFATMKISAATLTRGGAALAVLGAIGLLLPLPVVFVPVWFIVIGLGCAPIYPCMMHEAPTLFGAQNAAVVIGVQMVGAYLGITLMPPLFGAIAGATSMWLVPVFLLAVLGATLICIEILHRAYDNKESARQ